MEHYLTKEKADAWNLTTEKKYLLVRSYYQWQLLQIVTRSTELMLPLGPLASTHGTDLIIPPWNLNHKASAIEQRWHGDLISCLHVQTFDEATEHMRMGSTKDKGYPLILYQPMCQMKRLPRVMNKMMTDKTTYPMISSTSVVANTLLATSIAPHTIQPPGRPGFRMPCDSEVT